MAIEIKQRRTVPNKPGYGHAGERASLAVDESGYRAWGYGKTQAEADKAAFRAVAQARKS